MPGEVVDVGGSDPLRLALELALVLADARALSMAGIHISAALDDVVPGRARLVVPEDGSLADGAGGEPCGRGL